MNKNIGSILKKSETNNNEMAAAENETQKIYPDTKTDAILNCPCCMSLLVCIFKGVNVFFKDFFNYLFCV